jgi:transcriptional regulator with XRE-family HTH domain
MKEQETLRKLQERIGQSLAVLRKSKGYSSHEDFAYDHNIPRVQYWRIEKGKANLTLKSLLRLLAIHRITIDKFFSSLNKESKK